MALGAASGKIGAWAALVLSVAAIGYARPRAVATVRSAGVASEVFALPPPSVLITLSLGHRSALADLLYTSTIVSNGIHLEERRRFEFVGQYLDSIVALDPHFCQTYRYADTFIIYQAVGSPGPDEVRHARQLLERAGNDAVVLFLRGTASLAIGEMATARDELGRAISAGLPPQVEAAARIYAETVKHLLC